VSDNGTIKNVSARIGFLERRIEHLQRRVEERGGSDRAIGFDREEISALSAGLKALRIHRAQIEELDDPVLALEELAEALVAEHGATLGQRTRDALHRTRTVLEGWR
jgi:hypothetical protein